MRRIFTFASVVLSLLVLISGCSGLSDSQQTAVTFIDAMLVKKPGEDYQIHKRAEVILPIITKNPTDNDMASLRLLLEMVQSVYNDMKNENRSSEEIDKKMASEDFLNNYVVGPYFITENPQKPETETFSSQFIYIPSSSFEKERKDEYANIELIKEDGKWKISKYSRKKDDNIVKYRTDNPDAWEQIDP